ncbi:AI-2E family transporter [[Eubacterium] hominis]|uniref:AI-2E family transporter n=1 Tax=[Eubacterium] hominis TaxID=2764325 RepID=UPI003A4D3439
MKPKFMDESSWKTIKPWLFLSTYLILFVYILWNFSRISGFVGYMIGLFQSLTYGIVFAYILNIPMKQIEKLMIRHTKEGSFLRKRKRAISMTLTFVLALILIIILGSIILPSIIDSVIALFNNLTTFFSNIIENIDEVLAYFKIDFRVENVEQVKEFMSMPWEDVVKNAINILSSSASGLLSNASAFISSFAVGFTGFMFSLYLLSGKESFIRQIRKVVAAFLGFDHAQSVFRYASRVNKIFSSFISGQLMEACILWILYYVSMKLLGFPFTELICTLIALFSMIPVFGPMMAMVVGAIMMLSVDPLQSLWFMIFYQIMSQFEDNVIYPRVVGNSVGLPGLWVLLSIFVLGNVFGIFGMIVAVPVTACVYTFFAEAVNERLKKKKLIVTEDDMIKKEEQSIEG